MNTQNFQFKLEALALYQLKTCGPLQSLACRILEEIGKYNEITLTMRLIEGDQSRIAFYNKLIVGGGSDKIKLVIQSNDWILDSFSEVTISSFG